MLHQYIVCYVNYLSDYAAARLGSYSLNELIINLCENGHSLLLLSNSRIRKECFSHVRAIVIRLCAALDQVLYSPILSCLFGQKAEKCESGLVFAHFCPV